MNALLLNLTLLCSFTGSSQQAVDSTTVVTPPRKLCRVGELVIVGNTRTKQSVIVDSVKLYPGQVLTYPDIRMAEKNLKRLGIFKQATIEVCDDPRCPDSEFKDVIIHVEEENTAHACLTQRLDSKGDWTIRLIAEEKNFDPQCFPRSIDDIREGNAFRGAGLTIRMDWKLSIPLSFLRPPFASLRLKLPVAP